MSTNSKIILINEEKEELNQNEKWQESFNDFIKYHEKKIRAPYFKLCKICENPEEYFRYLDEDPRIKEQEILITRILHAPLQVVFKAWTNCEKLMHWWGRPSCKIDLRIGGAWRISIRVRDELRTSEGKEYKEYWHQGIYKEIVEPNFMYAKLVFTYAGDGQSKDDETLVTVTFHELFDGKTELTFHQASFVYINNRNNTYMMWSRRFDHLAKYVKGHLFERLTNYIKGIIAYIIGIIAERHTNRGNAHFDLKKYKEAIDDYTEAIRINPDSVAYFLRGVAHSALGECKESISDYTAAIRINPNNSYTYYYRGRAHNYLKEFKEAISDYSEAIRINPDYSDAYSDRGLLHNSLKEYKEAVDDYTKAIELNPQKWNSYLFRSIANAYLNNIDEALQDLNYAETNIDDSTIYNLACAYSVLYKFTGKKDYKNNSLKYLKNGLDKKITHERQICDNFDFEHLKNDPEFISIIGDCQQRM